MPRTILTMCKMCGVLPRSSHKSYTSYCGPCGNKRSTAWGKANPEKLKASQRRARLKKHYGITPEQYDEMLAAQGGTCAICNGNADRDFFDIDHDHKCCPGVKSCGECIRGLLCRSCNIGIGRLKDSVLIMHRAIGYLLA